MLQKLLLALGSLAASLAIAELALRVTGLGVHDFAQDQLKYGTLLAWDDAGQYFRHVPGTSAVVGGVTLRFNSLGMRDREPKPKRPGTVRILCLGDSVTFGPGVPEDLTYPARLRALLGIDVVVGAVQGWNTEQEERFLGVTIDRLAPDLVVLLYVLNDIEPTDQMQQAWAPATRWTERAHRWLVLRSRLFEWAAFVYRTRLAAPDWAGLGRRAYWERRRREEGPAFVPDDPGWRQSRAALERMAAVTRARGARLVIFFHDLGSPPLAPVALERLREFGAVAGVPVFDTAPFFAGHDPATLANRVFVDPHPNAQGHALLAAGVARALVEAGLVAPTGGSPASG